MLIAVYQYGFVVATLNLLVIFLSVSHDLKL